MSVVLFGLFGVGVGLAASFTGLGGGFVVVPVLLALGFAAQKAVGTTFVAILLISMSALAGHSRLSGVDWLVGIAIGVGGIVGAQIGPRLLQEVSTPAFQRIFALALLGLAAWTFFRK